MEGDIDAYLTVSEVDELHAGLVGRGARIAKVSRWTKPESGLEEMLRRHQARVASLHR